MEAGHRVFYTRTSDLMQRLQAARRDLIFEAALAKLDKSELISLDYITYAHKDLAETGVLFEPIARRYEYRSIAIAANQPFSGWDHIFPDKAMTVAAIDRVCQWARTIGASLAHSITRPSSRRTPKASVDVRPPPTKGPRPKPHRQPSPTTKTKERSNPENRTTCQPQRLENRPKWLSPADKVVDVIQ